MNFSIKDFFSKCDQIRRNLRIWSHLLKKFLMANLVFRAVSLVSQKCAVAPPTLYTTYILLKRIRLANQLRTQFTPTRYSLQAESVFSREYHCSGNQRRITKFFLVNLPLYRKVSVLFSTMSSQSFINLRLFDSEL